MLRQHNHTALTFFFGAELIPVSLQSHKSASPPLALRETLPVQERDAPTMWSDLLQVSVDSKVDQAAQPIVSRCQAFTLSIKSARRRAEAPSALADRSSVGERTAAARLQLTAAGVELGGGPGLLWPPQGGWQGSYHHTLPQHLKLYLCGLMHTFFCSFFLSLCF